MILNPNETAKLTTEGLEPVYEQQIAIVSALWCWFRYVNDMKALNEKGEAKVYAPDLRTIIERRSNFVPN